MVYNLSNFGCLSFPAEMQQQWDFIGRWINSKEVITDYELRKINSENEIHVLTVHHIHTKRKRMLEIPATKICGKFRIPSVDHVNNKMVCFAGLEVSDHVAFTELGPEKEISLNLHKTDGYLIGNTLSRDGNQALIVKRKFDKLQPDLLHIGAGLSNLICLELWDVKSQKNLQSYYGPEAVGVSGNGHPFIITGDFSSQNDFIICGSETGTIYIFEKENGILVSQIPAHNCVVSAIAYHPNLDMFATCSDDGSVKIFFLPK